MMNSTSVETSTSNNKFLRSHPGWVYWVRHPIFVVVSFLIIIGYAVFLLPVKGTTPPFPYYLSISVFIVLIMAWSAIILADQDKSELLKGVVAFGMIATFCWLFYQYSGAEWDRLAKAFFAWERLEGNWWILFDGLKVTLFLAVVSAIASVLVGLAVAILRSFNSPTLNLFLVAYVDIFRSIPMIVLMVVLFFALPYVGLNLGSILSTIVALALGYGAYASESFRAGIESVHSGQIEAARSLGLSRWQTIRMIILPQAIPVVIPPLTGNLVAMLKDTAVASVVAAPELLKRSRELYTSKTSPTPLVAAAMMYLVVLIPMVRIVNMLENRMKGRNRK